MFIRVQRLIIGYSATKCLTASLKHSLSDSGFAFGHFVSQDNKKNASHRLRRTAQRAGGGERKKLFLPDMYYFISLIDLKRSSLSGFPILFATMAITIAASLGSVS